MIVQPQTVRLVFLRTVGATAFTLALAAACASYSSTGSATMSGASDAAPDAAQMKEDATTPALSASRVAVVVPGISNSCVVTADTKALYCVGRIGSGEHQRLPASAGLAVSQGWDLVDEGPIEKVALAANALCVLKNGTARCWGDNSRGALGHQSGTGGDQMCNGTYCNAAPSELVNVPSGTKFSEIVAGNAHFCARSLVGEVYCWGDNAYGQSAGDRSESTLPHLAVMPGGKKVTSLGAGSIGTCAALENVGLACWGYDYLTSIGAPALSDAGTPSVWCGDAFCVTNPSLIPGLEGTRILEVDLGDRSGCVINALNEVLCFDAQNPGGGIPTLSPRALGVTAAVGLSFGQYSGLVRSGTDVLTWGTNARAALGAGAPLAVDGGTEYVENTPAARATLSGATQAAMSPGSNGMAIKDGKILGWGANQYGQLNHPPGAASGDSLCDLGVFCSPTPVIILP
jgi:Regulator of chromosome condensation (RCC1) repeat